MILFVQLAAASDVPPIHDEGDALYLERTGRAREAALWHLEQMAREPATTSHLVRYLTAVGQVPELRSIALVLQVEQWRAAHPEAADAGVPLAMAHYFTAVGPHTWSSPFAIGGAWCEPAADVLATLPEDPKARYQVLWARSEIGQECGTSWEEDPKAALDALALSGEAGPFVRAMRGAADGVDAADVEALEAALVERPWQLWRLAQYAPAELEGDAAATARALVLERARAAVAEDRPSRIWGGAIVLDRAGLADEARAARERLQALDPGNEHNTRSLERRPEEPNPDAPPEPGTLLDPAARLAALQQAGPPSGTGWERLTYWNALVDAAEAAGDQEAQLDALDRLWRIDPGSGSNLRFAELTAATGARLRQGARAARHGVASRRDRRVYELPDDPQDERRWREALAEALDARALVAEARGRQAEARQDLEEALSLAGPDPDRLLRLGSLYLEGGSAEAGAPLLGRAIGELPADDPRVADARARLSEHLAGSPGWAPDLDTFLAASRAPEPPAAEAEAQAPLDGSRFADLTLTIDGKEQRLLDLEGPIVLEVWATWCGPCVQSLPHFDAVSREYAGKITFVAVSVDDDPAVAERYLARRGEPGFVPAYLAGEGMRRLGLSGIPATFVFDAEHQLVALMSGWGPGNTELDEAVEAMLARQPGAATPSGGP